MDIILIFNGLGNQMSQYALYLAKKQYNPSVRFLYFPSTYDDQHNGFELDKVFKIKMPKDVKYYILFYIYSLYLLKDKKGIKGKFIRKLINYLKVNVIYENFTTYAFNPSYLLKNSGFNYYWGGWHCEKYFNEIKDELSGVFHFIIDEKDTRTIKLQKEIQNKMSVSIHLRRGDYLSKRLVNVFGDVCDIEYYNKAIHYIQQHIENPYFYIFSDDKQWIKENFKLPNSVIVDFNKGNDSWKDMYLMSQCKHNINANSTFSWWSAWLNNNPDKIVVVPNRFSLQEDSQEVYPESWIKILATK
jgi:hypothetical protein